MLRIRPLSEYRETLVLALPLIIGQLGQIVLAFVDSAMIGNYGVNELAAASFCINLFNLPVIFLMGYSYGVLPALGRVYHSKLQTHTVITKGLKNIFWISGGVAILMVLPLLRLSAFQQPQELNELITPYYLLMLCSLPVVAAFNVLKQYFDTLGKTWIPMVVLLVANLSNALGNYLLIFGNFHCPEFGLFGAGLASLFARVLGCLILGLLYGYTLYKTRFARLREQINGTTTKVLGRYELIRAGAGTGVQMGLETALFSISVIFVGMVGGAIALAAHQIAVTIQTLGFMTYYGLGGAVAIRVSRYMGQHHPTRALIAANVGFRLHMLCAAVLMLILFYFRHPICELFSSSPKVIDLAGLLLLVGIAYQPIDALQVCYSNALRGMGNATGLFFASFIGYFTIGLPLAYLLGIHTNLTTLGVWLSYPIGLLTAGLLYAWRFYHSINKQLPRYKKTEAH